MMTTSAQSSTWQNYIKRIGCFSVCSEGPLVLRILIIATSAFVSVNVVTAKVVEIGGVPVMPIDVPKLINYTYLGNGVATPTTWVGCSSMAMATRSPIDQPRLQARVAFNVAAVAPNATKVDLFFDNTLLAQSEANSFAFYRQEGCADSRN